METIKRSALVAFSAEQMYQLVVDVEKYPEFVPYCKKATITGRENQKIFATLEVAKSGIAKSFSTQNSLKPFENIHIQLLDGPFKHLDGNWYFKPLSESACKIELDLEFEFSSRLASLAFSAIFSQLMQSMVAAFSKRAEEIYY